MRYFACITLIIACSILLLHVNTTEAAAVDLTAHKDNALAMLAALDTENTAAKQGTEENAARKQRQVTVTYPYNIDVTHVPTNYFPYYNYGGGRVVITSNGVPIATVNGLRVVYG